MPELDERVHEPPHAALHPLMLIACLNDFLELIHVKGDSLFALARADVNTLRLDIMATRVQRESTTGVDVAAAHAALRAGGDV